MKEKFQERTMKGSISIYVLYEIGTSDIRYVGKTTKPVAVRLEEHLRSSALSSCYKRIGLGL